MTHVDLEKLKDFQQRMKERSKSTGSSLFINRGDLDEPKEIRILEPHPAMDDLYFIEVVSWWIDGIKLYSNEIVGEEDIVQGIVTEAEHSGDPEIKKLLKAKTEKGYPRIRKDTEFWIPVLHLEFEEEEGQIVSDIYDENGDYDVDKIRNFIADNRIKILCAPISLLNDINRIATTRGGSVMFDRDKGFNLLVSRTKSGKSTTYKAHKTDNMPMPEDFYGTDNMFNPYDLVESMMLNDDYQKYVIENYLYGDVEIPEDKEEYYKYPEKREEMVEFFKSVEKDEEKETKSRRPRAKKETEEEETKEEESKPSRSGKSESRSSKGRGRPPKSRAKSSSRTRISDDYDDQEAF